MVKVKSDDRRYELNHNVDRGSIIDKKERRIKITHL